MREGNARAASPPVSGLHHLSTSATSTSTNISHLDTTLLYLTTTKINPFLDSSAVWRRINSPFLYPWPFLFVIFFPHSCGKIHRRKTQAQYMEDFNHKISFVHKYRANANNYMQLNLLNDVRSVLSLVLRMFQLCHLKLSYTALIFASDSLKMFRFLIYSSVLSAYSCLNYLFSLYHHVSYQFPDSFLFYYNLALRWCLQVLL